ncbi:hypothetical protein [Alteraurantiacibacter buctensis]|uniref:Uncharacterized protein n=1 Tax=Alteraurantiacibacter buctensis TaxID=1503981 RepID=A0A844Z2Q9_9SPHN|nr:hypothetical protein [Alteraurantiacibacter buctensis]MXO72787.1 hypothetical protein [Alteraurantiacibacter buctensis]
MALDPHQILQAGGNPDNVPPAPLAGTHQQRLQRLQIGLLGLGGILLLVGLANIIIAGARQSEQEAVAELPAPSAEDLPEPGRRDPLADAGVAPGLPADDAADSAAGAAEAGNDLELAPQN